MWSAKPGLDDGRGALDEEKEEPERGGRFKRTIADGEKIVSDRIPGRADTFVVYVLIERAVKCRCGGGLGRCHVPVEKMVGTVNKAATTLPGVVTWTLEPGSADMTGWYSFRDPVHRKFVEIGDCHSVYFSANIFRVQRRPVCHSLCCSVENIGGRATGQHAEAPTVLGIEHELSACRYFPSHRSSLSSLQTSPASLPKSSCWEAHSLPSVRLAWHLSPSPICSHQANRSSQYRANPGRSVPSYNSRYQRLYICRQRASLPSRDGSRGRCTGASSHQYSVLYHSLNGRQPWRGSGWPGLRET